MTSRLAFRIVAISACILVIITVCYYKYRFQLSNIAFTYSKEISSKLRPLYDPEGYFNQSTTGESSTGMVSLHTVGMTESELITTPSLHSPESDTGSNCFTTEASRTNMLSIHMVIIPYLVYKASSEKILKRQEEYKYALQQNLAHPLVQCIHILTTNSTETLQVFGGLSNQSKVLVSEVKSIDLARDPFQYISQRLLNRNVMFSNADIYLGAGFDQIDPTVMDREKIMYSVTRRLAPVECNRRKSGDPAWSCKKYIGSHDIFLFRLHKPLPETFFKCLNFDLVSPGIENIVIGLFRKELDYCVLNPCSILEIFHYHCTDLRNREGKPRVNKGYSRQQLAYFTKRLNCSH